MKTLIIAEVGVNHNGDLEIAKSLVDIAADSGADIVKFQTFKADRLVTETASKAEYQISATGNKEFQHEMLKKLELSDEMHRELISHCKFRNIEFLSTGFDIESIDYLISLGQKLFKVPSGEITNLPYLRHIGKLGGEVILSTGMSEMHEILSAVKILEESGTQRRNITVLHCTSAYPVPIEEVNLLAMKSIKDSLKVKVGYSDHTLGIEIPIAAVALGAIVIEKHFTLDRNMEGPDHKASLEPSELKLMIEGIRKIELGLGDGIKKITPSESGNREVARKSLVAKQSIKQGEEFTTENVTCMRPGIGISPMEWDRLIGSKSHRSFEKNELLDES